MRRGHDGLFAVVSAWGLDPFSGDLFAFVGRRRDRVKSLVWHRGGFVLLYRRVERGRFRIPRVPAGAERAVLDATELTMLLDGIDLAHVKRALVGSALANDFEPTAYLTDVLLRVAAATTDEDLDALLPGRWKPPGPTPP